MVMLVTFNGCNSLLFSDFDLSGLEDLPESFGGFEVGHDWQYVAIISAEEGHPMLAIYNLETWITSGKQASPLYVFNPYPATVHLIGWENNDFLTGLNDGKHGLNFSTDGPVDLKETASGSWPRQPMREFRWHKHDMKLIPISPVQQEESAR